MIYSTGKVAEMTGLTPGRIRQIAREAAYRGKPIGLKIDAGQGDWVFTEDDVQKLRDRPRQLWRWPEPV